MQYFVSMTVRTTIVDREGKTRAHNSVTHIPAFSRADAEGMCELMSRELLSDCGNRWDEHQQTRAFEITARVWTQSKGSIYLSVAELEMMACEFAGSLSTKAA